MNNLKHSRGMPFSSFTVQVPLQSSVDTKSLKKQFWDLWDFWIRKLKKARERSAAGITSWSLLSTRVLPQKAESSQNFCLVTKRKPLAVLAVSDPESDNTRQKYFCPEHGGC